MQKTIIKGTGCYVPPRVVTNDDLAKWMDTSDEWIRQRTGIEQRHWVPENGGVGSSDLGLEASKNALKQAGWSPEDIDLIIFGTMTPDIYLPGSGCILQHKLGLETTPALDIRQQCTGFIYGITTADAFIRSGHAQRILFVGAEVHSTALDLSTRGRHISVIFGDGAGAVCLEGVETSKPAGVLASTLHAQGKLAHALMMELPSHKMSPFLSKEMMKEGRQYPTMDGRLVFKTAVKRLSQVTKNVLKKANLSIDDVDLFIPHQANLRINEAFGKMMNLSPKKVFNNIQRYGNTTAASIPIALDEAIKTNRIHNGDTVIFLALGAGVTWGAVVYRFAE